MNSPIVQFCIDECKRQNDYTPEAVGGMVEAYCYTMQEFFEYYSMETILTLGKFVKPQNIGFRTTPVVFQNGNSGIHYSQIERALKNLLDAVSVCEITPDEFYFEFEKIHPFEDGNGRVGAILWNLYEYNRNPSCPPDFY